MDVVDQLFPVDRLRESVEAREVVPPPFFP